MKKLTGIRICVLSALLTCATMNASAYNESVHAVISEHATRQSVLYTSPSLLADWGYSGGPLTTTFPSYDFSFRTIASMVGQGAFHEDNLSQFKRVFNHFTDAQFDPPFGIGLQGPVLGTIGHPSPRWALEDTTTVTSVGVPFFVSAGGIPQIYSYRDAQEHFFQALTSQNPGNRLTEFGAVFQTLGHVVHHVQDMGQPQHTRNESHISEGLFTDVAGSWYERYTSLIFPAEVPEILQALLTNTPYNGGVIPSFSTAREFWSQASIPGPRFRGMADFTARNYVGVATNFRVNVAGNGNVTFLGDPDQPLPNGTNRDGTTVRLERVARPLTLLDGSVRNTSMRYAIGKVYDEYTNQTQERILASESIFLPAFGAAGPLEATMATNSVVFDDNYQVLLPRASAFSTGLINHFFRGRLELQRTTSTGTNWTITNVGTQNMSGEFSIYREDSAGTRSPAAGPWTLAVNAGQGTIVSVPEPPSGTSRLVAVFRGQIGAEGSVSSGFYAVAGKVTTFASQAVACGSSFSAAGSSAGNTTLMDLGSTAGPVKGEFEAYYIPDSLVIHRGSSAGPVLFTTNGAVPGFHTFTIQHPGGADPAQNKLWIKVTGNTDPATQWTSTVSCPNQSITNSDRVRDRISVRFGSTATGGGTGCPYGHYNIYLNDLFGPGTVSTVTWGQGAQWSNPVIVTEGTRHWLRVHSVTDSHGNPGAVNCSPPAKPQMSIGISTVRDISGFVGNATGGGGILTIP